MLAETFDNYQQSMQLILKGRKFYIQLWLWKSKNKSYTPLWGGIIFTHHTATHTHILKMTTPFVCQNGLYSFHLSISYLWFLSPAFLYHPIHRSVFLVLLTLSCFLMPPDFLHRDLSVLTETETLTKHTKLKCEHLKMTQTYIRENNTVLYKIILQHFIRKKYFFLLHATPSLAGIG
jgi:hypothetical protein